MPRTDAPPAIAADLICSVCGRTLDHFDSLVTCRGAGAICNECAEAS